jgi:soluble cytochrome b562
MPLTSAISHEDIQLLVTVITGSVQTIGWVAGICTTILVGLCGVSLTVAFKSMGGRITSVNSLAVAAQSCAKTAQDAAKNMTSQCAQTRAGCREDLLGRFLEKSEIKDMEHGFQNLVTTTMNQLQTMIREDRGLLIEKLDDIKSNQTNFQKEIWDAVHGHIHADDGLVIRK